jgi:bifunctional non-homologous end joining protein LigD
MAKIKIQSATTALTTRSKTRKKSASPLSKIVGVHRSPRPSFIPPAHPSLWPAPPNGADWLHELKFDGYRMQLHVFDKKATLFTRRGDDWTDRFGSIASVLRSLQHDAIFDGEIVALDDQGRPNFHFLQLAVKQPDTKPIVYFAFDLLYLDGFDVRDLQLIERRELVRSVLTAETDQVDHSTEID